MATAKLNTTEESTRLSSGRASSHTWLWPILCCFITLAAILAANPFNEAGFNDDWSYGRVAMNLANHGRLEYNGWGSPLLLFQIIWAFPWIKAFGFSFQVLQTSMIPISLGFVLMAYALGRQVGLPRSFAAFASLAVGTSPLFVPLAATFMTDCCGALFSLVCIYAALKIVSCQEDRYAVGWLWILAVAGVVGGANRQIVWIAPVVLIPYVAWTCRGTRRFVAHAAAAYLFCGVSILAVMHFFAQPYGPAQMTHEQIVWLLHNGLGGALRLLFNFLFICILLSFPVLFCFVPMAPRRPSLRLILFFAAALLATMVEARFSGPDSLNVLTFQWVPMYVIPAWLCLYLALFVNCFVLGAAASLPGLRRLIGMVRRDRTVAVFGVFALGYFVLLIPGIVTGLAYDRYMLPVIPLIMVLALRVYGRQARQIPMAAWVCLGIFGVYSVAATHDFAEGLRTRIALAHQLENSGVDRYRVSAGIEYDGWTQLERTDDVRVARFEDRFVDDSGKGYWNRFWNHLPGFRPDYVVLNADEKTPVEKAVYMRDFFAWLPPFRRSAGVWKRSHMKGR